MSWHKADRPSRRRWARVRLLVLDRDGWKCSRCGISARLEVDHIKPLEHDGAVYDLGNLQALCRSCHIDKTRRQNTGRGPSPEVEAWKRYLTTT